MTPMRRSRRVSSRGGAYVLVLIMAMILTTLGLTAHLLVMQRLETQKLRSHATEADLIAMSAIDLALHDGVAKPDWSSSYPSGQVLPETTIGAGSATVRYTDNSADPGGRKTLRAVAKRAAALRILEVEADPILDPMPILSYAMTSRVDTIFDQVDFYANEPIHANDDVSATTSAVSADVNAVGWISGGQYKQSTNDSASTITIPSYAAMSFYLAEGVAIPIGDIPGDRIENALISPFHNPYGPTSRNGIYVIQCAGRSLEIRDSRIIGTLVLHQAGSGTRIRDAVRMEKGEHGYPVLIVDGDLELSLGKSDLDEASTGVNFNPTGAPSGGEEDNDLADTYQPIVQGLVFAGGRVAIEGPLNLEGLLIAGQIECRDRVFIVHDRGYVDTPPPGFGVVTGFTMVPGTWRRGVN